jgi:mono/diheme cytochrome c family protein
MRTRSLWAAFVLVFAAAAANAQQPLLRGDPREGRRLARDRCETCHIVAADQEIKPLVPNYGPSFFDVASRPGTNAESIESFLLHRHRFGNMPSPDLTAAQAADLASYILSLKGRH